VIVIIGDFNLGRSRGKRKGEMVKTRKSKRDGNEMERRCLAATLYWLFKGL
jgi:hypothetical protein